MKKIFILTVMMAMLSVFSVQAHADLQYSGVDNLGNGLIYDSALDITWYDYTNSAHWPEAWLYQMDWADALDVNVGGNHYTNWRLPTALNQDGSGPCFSFNCTGSEMGHLFYTELGNSAGGPLTNTGDFQNLQSTYYWSGVEHASILDYAWIFRFDNGFQGYGHKPSFSFSALAVHPGDVTAVPEPGTLLLLGSGLIIGLAFYSRRKVRKTN